MFVNKKVREQLTCSKWLSAIEDSACKKIAKFANITELKVLEKNI
jgi:hypothetical protein